MFEPFFIVINSEPENHIYFEHAPVEFKNPTKGLYLIPMTSRILALDRGLYTVEEVNENKAWLQTAMTNTIKNALRKNTDSDFISIRSNKSSMPCAAIFMINNPEKIFNSLSLNIDDYYVIFITSDEVMFAEKSKYKPTQIKKIIMSIKNKMNSLCPDASPILATEIFEYDKEVNRYVEV